MKKIFIVALAACITAPSWAMQNIKLGGLSISPFVSSEMKYDSNIYLTKTSVKSAWINDSAVGVRFGQKFGSRLDLNAGYELDLITYSVNQSNNNAVHHTADIALTGSLANDMTVKLADQFLATTDQASSELTARAKRVENDAAFNFVAPIKGKFGFKINAGDSYNKYLDTAYENLDRNRVDAGADITYQLQPKTQLAVGYTFSNVDYKTNNRSDSRIQKVDAGLNGQIAPKVTGEIMAGAQFRKYSNDLGTASNKATTFSYGLTLTWQPGTNSKLMLVGLRDNIESVYANSRYYTSTQTNLNFEHNIGKWVGNIGLGYENARYPEVTPGLTDKRNDNYLRASADLDYNIQKWLKAGVGYLFRNRNSNESANNYDDHQVALEVRATF